MIVSNQDTEDACKTRLAAFYSSRLQRHTSEVTKVIFQISVCPVQYRQLMCVGGTRVSLAPAEMGQNVTSRMSSFNCLSDTIKRVTWLFGTVLKPGNPTQRWVVVNYNNPPSGWRKRRGYFSLFPVMLATLLYT